MAATAGNGAEAAFRGLVAHHEKGKNCGDSEGDAPRRHGPNRIVGEDELHHRTQG